MGRQTDQRIERPATAWSKVRAGVRFATRSRSGPIAWIMYMGIRTIFAVLQMFPLEWSLGTARALARGWPRIMPRHRERAVKHLTESFGSTLSPEEIERLADRCLESVAMFAVEAICLPRRIHAFNWKRYIETVNFDEALDLLLAGKGVILLTGHFGSFEVTAHLLAMVGFDVVAMMRPLDNVYLNRFLVESRRSNGLTVLNKKGATVHAERILSDGRPLAIVGDQDAGRKGVFVNFFGRPASTYKSIGLLAMSTQCPIVVGYARRKGNHPRYEVGVQRIIRPEEWESQDDPLQWITQTYTTAIEEMVRRAPEQYLWIHRRWKSQPRVRKRASNGGMDADQFVA